jgi:hypothetical protein
MRVREMVVVKPRYGKKKPATSPNERHAVRCLFNPLPLSSSKIKLEDFAEALFPETPSAVAFLYSHPNTQSQVTPSSDLNVQDVEEVVTSPHLPPSLSELVEDHEFEDEFIDSLKLTTDEVAAIEEATRGQHESSEWTKQRIGRITGSVCHGVLCKVKRGNTETGTTLDSIMGQNVVPDLPALRYGRFTEEEAAEAYVVHQRNHHPNLTAKECGLFVHPQHGFLAASPDRLVTCSCCQSGLVEIKCPFSAINQCITHETVKYLTWCDGVLQLKRSHQYYSQIQQQLGVTGRQWCDFVVYTKKELFIERIYFDVGFWDRIVASARLFFRSHIFRALIKQSLDANAKCT